MQYDFISYSRKDYVDDKKNIIPNNVISKIKESLSDAGITYWLDEEGINGEVEHIVSRFGIRIKFYAQNQLRLFDFVKPNLIS